MFSILASVVEVMGENGKVVKVVKSFPVEMLPFLLLFLVIALVISYLFFKKRLEHKQIMAAIEKGIPLSELRPAKPTGPAWIWIKSITVSIVLLLMSLPFLFKFLEPLIRRSYFSESSLMLFGILFAIGLAFFIRGLLLRKAQRQIQPSGHKQKPEKMKT